MTAQALGITGGYPDGGFHPGSPVTRQDAAVFLMKAMRRMDGAWAAEMSRCSAVSGTKAAFQTMREAHGSYGGVWSPVRNSRSDHKSPKGDHSR